MLRLLLLVLLWTGRADHKHSLLQDIKVTLDDHTGNTVASATQINDRSEVDKQQPKSKPNEGTLFWQRPEWISVALTGVYTLVSLGTLVAIFHQNRSIQNNERAVLIPMWDNFVHSDPTYSEKHTFSTKFKNCGKTPAFIRGYQCNMILLNSLDDLGSSPKYLGIVTSKGDPLTPEGMTDTSIFAHLENGRDFEEVSDDYRKNGKILYAYGLVRYDDIYGRQHVTRFGVRYDAQPSFSIQFDRWVVDGPDSYNKYT